MSARKRFLFIRNPASGSAKGLKSADLARLFPASDSVFTKGPGDATTLARKGAEEGFIPVAVGGDGTFREVAFGVKCNGPMGFIPLGTINLVAMALKIPKGARALEILARGEESGIYPGICEANGEESYFFIGVSAGPDADSVHGASLSLKKRIGRSVYALSFMKRLLKPVKSEIACLADGETAILSEAVALRMAWYGGPYRLGEKVSLFERGIELVGTGGGRARVLRLFASAASGGIIPPPPRFSKMCEKIILKSREGLLQIDGDPLFASAATMTCGKTPLKVISGS